MLKPQQQRHRSTHDVTTESISMFSVTSCDVKVATTSYCRGLAFILYFKPFNFLCFG